MKSKNQKSFPVALTIAGSDSSGGAGIQADLKTFSALRVIGKSVVASVTSQNSMGVVDSFDLPPEVIESQIKAVFADVKPGAVKTGMLGNEAVVQSAARILKKARVKNLVVDPVIFSSSRKRLLSRGGVERLKGDLLPLALLVTPNLYEAEMLSGVRIQGQGDCLKAAKIILKTGVKNVLIKGGHAKGNADDLFYDGKKAEVLKSARLTGGDRHGTGCVLSAAIAGGLARGDKLSDAVRQAKDFIHDAIAHSLADGKGTPSVHPLAGLYREADRWDLFHRVSLAMERLKAGRVGGLIPEVQSNLAVGLDNAQNRDDVLGIPGRIIKSGEDIATLDAPRFGASRHVADIVLTTMNFDPEKRAVMNIKCDKKVLKICRKLKLSVGSFDRAAEPRQIKEKEGSTLEWGTANAIRKAGYVPDIIYDLGGMGKEEMVRVIAPDIETLTDRVLEINRLYKKG